MPQRRQRFRRLVARRLRVEPARETPAELRPRARRASGGRIAASLTFAALFFAGAALSAGAGGVLTDALETATEPAPAQEAAPSAESPDADECRPEQRMGRLADDEECADEGELPGSEPAPAPEQAGGESAAPAPEAQAPEAAPAESSDWQPSAALTANELRSEQPTALSAMRRVEPASAPAQQAAAPVIAPRPALPKAAEAEEPEAELPGATIWLQRDLPDPTPPSRRLTPGFARQLATASRRERVHWSLVLAVLRARGERGSVPANARELASLARTLGRLGGRSDAWSAALALEGRTAFADRTLALSRYHRAVGLAALVHGLEWGKASLARRIMRDERVSLYPGGRADIESGKTDVRVLVLIAYLAEAHGQVTVSSLTAGHRLFARPGVVSAHIYGLAVDIATLGGRAVAGNSQPGGITEQGVRDILLLPAELRPRQVISLLGLGGPSFPLGDHGDHIHVGY